MERVARRAPGKGPQGPATVVEGGAGVIRVEGLRRTIQPEECG